MNEFEEAFESVMNYVADRKPVWVISFSGNGLGYLFGRQAVRGIVVGKLYDGDLHVRVIGTQSPLKLSPDKVYETEEAAKVVVIADAKAEAEAWTSVMSTLKTSSEEHTKRYHDFTRAPERP